MIRTHVVAIALLLAIGASILQAAEVTITGPARINAGAYAFYQVVGLGENDPLGATVAMTGETDAGKPIPSDTMVCLPFSGWGGGGHLLFVSAGISGRYKITVTLNGWRSGLDRAVADAAGARVAAELLGELQAVAGKAAGAYPYRSGSTVLEVTGANPPPPPPPPPPEVGRRWILVFYESQTADPALTLQLLQLRASQYLRDKQHAVRLLDDDLPAAAAWLGARKLTTLPALVVTELTAGDGAGRVLYSGVLPGSFDATLALVQQHGG